jgi:DNA topoisomerase I
VRAHHEAPTKRADGAGAAHRARLRYVAWSGPGIRRVRRGKSFGYVLPDGSNLESPSTLERIRSLAIPPAWKDVWICPSANGHLQATGRDARGRLQYRYHPRWRLVRDEAKYDDVVAFARLLPRLRRRMARDLSHPKLTKDKVTATVVRVMECTSVRVGNDRYAESNHSYGLTTLLDRHARIQRGSVEFRFRGKGGKPYRAALSDTRLAAIVRRCRDIPGQRLFQYADDKGGFHALTSTDVNRYLRRSMGRPFTAKTFRTWAGTLAVGVLLAGTHVGRTHRAREHAVRRAIERVAEQLGNTAAVCRKSYVHPAIVSAYTKGALVRLLPKNTPRARPAALALLPEERAVLGLFEGRPRRRRARTARSR